MKVVLKLSIFTVFTTLVFVSCFKENTKKENIKKEVKMENVKTSIVTVSDKLADCVGAHGKRKCLLIKDEKTNKENFLYSNIEGFKYEEGFSYKLKIEIFKIKNPPADASNLKYKLVKIISKNKV